MDYLQEKEMLSEEFCVSKEALCALGSKTRQHIILSMIRSELCCDGMRVDDIEEAANLSRSSVSHHLQILRAAGILDVRHEGKKNYYYFNENTETLEQLIQMLSHAKELLIRSADQS